ncbi:hypothetical protein [Maribacter sp. 2-571]|uniref:hypothetical protein n=1 Tax=Maribacter sp. 2-571 TaxID=3417569 RepID=UPI003D330042
MNVQDFTYLLQHPDKVVSPVHTNQLEEVLQEYPFFQTARALHLKGLKNLNSFKYNKALKITAAHTADREVLFDYITSQDFLQNNLANTLSKKNSLTVAEENPSEQTALNANSDVTNTSVEQPSEDTPLPQNLKEANIILDPELFTAKNKQDEQQIDQEETPDYGAPLPFTKREKHSFAEWLQLASFKTVKRKNKEIDAEREPIDFPLEESVLKNKNFELIDKFIATNPKITPTENPTKVNISDSVKIDKKELMTETLARVYMEQKKYKKAIQAYKILSLKYPEKSGFFADRIKAVEKIRKEQK